MLAGFSISVPGRGGMRHGCGRVRPVLHFQVWNFQNWNFHG